jgi:hypothetical protein
MFPERPDYDEGEREASRHVTAQQAEAVRNLLAVRQVGLNMVDVFSESRGREAAEALRGAEVMVATINHVLELLGAPPDLNAEGQHEPV